MRYYKCTVLVAVPDEALGEYFDGGDEGFLLQDAVNDAGGYVKENAEYDEVTVHLLGNTDSDIDAFEFMRLRNAGCWPEGGV